MGWTGVRVSRWQSAGELTGMAMRLFFGQPGHRVIDQSGWTNSGREKYVLLEFGRDHPDFPGERLIAVVTCRQRQGTVLMKAEPETEMPEATGCPMRLLKKAEAVPSKNPGAIEWRRRVREARERRKEVRQLLKTLREDLAHGGDLRVVLRDGTEARYTEGVYQGKDDEPSYRVRGEPIKYRLTENNIDLEATLILRAAGER